MAVTLVPLVSTPARAATLVVGPGQAYETIQAAVFAATDGDVIEVQPGEYTTISVGAKILTIRSTGGPDVTTIVPASAGDLILGVNTGSVVLEGFTLTGANRTGGNVGGAIWVNNIAGSLTVTNSVITGNSGPGGGGIANWGTLNVSNSVVSFNSSNTGGGINNAGTATIVDSTIENNTASGNGGGLAIADSSLAIDKAFEIRGSTIVGNAAGSYGGGLMVAGGSVEIANSTFSGNSAGFMGGGIAARPPSEVLATVRMNNVTVAQNLANSLGGGVYIDPTATMRIANTVIGDNSAPIQTTTADCNGGTLLVDAPSVVGRPNTTPVCTYELSGDGVVLTGTTNLTALADNGGPTKTYLPGPETVMIDAGSTSEVGSGYPACEVADQRGQERPQGAACDIGSVEADAVEPPNTPPVANDDMVTAAAGTEVFIDVLANDTDADGDQLIISEVVPAGASVTCRLNETWGGCTFIADAPGTFDFQYTVSDGTGSDTATVTVEVRDRFGGTGTADVDGVFGEGEWAGADRFDIRFFGLNDDARFEDRAGTLYLMNDATDLYAAIEFRPDTVDPTFTFASAAFYLGDLFFGWDSNDGFGDFADGDAALSADGDLVEFRLSLGGATPSSLPLEVAFEFEGYEPGTVRYTAEIPQDLTSGLSWDLFFEGGDVTEASVGLDSNTIEAGYGVALEDIPSDRLLVGVDRITGAPLGAIGLAESPLGAIPLGAIPLGAIGGTSTSTVLSDVRIAGGWEPLLAGTSLEGRPLQTITLAEALAAIPADRLAGLSLSDLDPATSPVGGLPLSTLLLAAEEGAAANAGGAGGVAAAPLGAIPLGAIPLGAIPLGAIPLGAIPLGAIGAVRSAPLGAIPLGAIGDLAAAPLGAIPLGAIPLGAIPLGAIPLGAIPLGSIPLGSIPLGAIDLGGGDFCDFHDAEVGPSETCDALGIDPLTTAVYRYTELLGSAGDLAATPLGAIPLGAIPLGAIPLGAIDVSSVPLGAIPLGAIPLGAIPLGAIPLGAIPLGSIDACAGFTDTECSDTTLLADYVALFGSEATLASTPLGAIPLGAIPLGAIPLGAIPLGSITIAGVPLGSIPLGAIDLRSSPLGAIPLGAIPLGAIPLGSITLGSLPLGAIDTGCPTCTADTTLQQYLAAVGETSLAATPLGAIPLGAIPVGVLPLGSIPLGAIDPADLPADATLADVLDHLTIAFLGATEGGFGGLTFGELLVSILLAGDFPWEDLPLDQVETRDVAGVPAPDTITAFVGFATEGTLDRVTVRVTPPDGFLYVPGSAVATASDESSRPALEPLLVEGVLLFDVLGPIPAGVHKFEASFFAPLRLGAGSFSTAVAAGETVVFAPETPLVTVLPRKGPDTAATAGGIVPDALYLGHIDRTDDEDWFSIPAPDQGTRVAVFLSNLDGDVDLFLYRPETAVVGSAESVSAIPLGSTPVEDYGVDPTGEGSLSPENTADNPVDPDLTLAAISTNRGDATESTSIFSRAGEVDDYLIQVSGYDTAVSSAPYVLRVKYEAAVAGPACTARTLPDILAGTSLPLIPAGTSSLILANPQRFASLLGSDGGVGAALDDLATVADGVVVDIASIPGVVTAFNAWDDDPCDVAAANEVAGLIVGWVQATVATSPSIRDVTIVGSDEVIPFVRLEDTTVVANESTYVEGFEGALLAAHATRHYLSDAPYGDLDPVPWLDRYAYLPELGVGRLVEEPDHIVGAIQTFLDEGGVLSPETAAVAGYDFLTDGAQAVKTGLVENGLTDVDSAGALINETWTRQDLLDEAYSEPLPDVVSPNAHYDHYRALPAIGNLTGVEADLFTIDDLDLPPDALEARIVFTMGCHSGLSVPNGTGATNATDWAEVYGAARAIYVGNTGYGYGDTATVALTEQLMANLAANLDGTLTIGQALAQAKQDQFGRAGLYGVYDLKAIEEATLYGLPMWAVDVDGGPPVELPAVGPVTSEPVSGLEAAQFSVEPTFQQVNSAVGTYFAADGETQFLHWRPIQPRLSVDATQDGKVATGVLLTDLETRDVTVGDAAFARPTTTSGSAREPEVETAGVVFPSTFAQIGTSTRLGPDGPARRQLANLVPGQFRGNETGAGGTQRLFDRVAGLVHYADDPAGVDWTAPRIGRVAATVIDGLASFEVEATAGGSGVSRVLVLFRSSSGGTGDAWTPVDLTLVGGVWRGAAPAGGATPPLDYLVQAVNGDGVVGVSSFKGEFHQAPAAPPPPGSDSGISCNGEDCESIYDGAVTVAGPEGSTISVDGGEFAPGPVVVDGDGLHSVVVRFADGTETSFLLLVDTQVPQVFISVPTEDAVYGVGETVLARFTCIDVSLVTCVGSNAVGDPIDTSPGPHTFTVTATDAFGRTTTESVTYSAVYTFEGFFAPVVNDRENVLNVPRNLPVKFRLIGADGAVVSETSVVTRVRFKLGSCSVDAPPEEVIDDADLPPSLSSGLSFDADEQQFVYGFKTQRAWKGKCGELSFEFADGSTSPLIWLRFR